MRIQEKFDTLPPEVRTELVWAQSALNDAVAMLPVFAREATGGRAKRFVEVMVYALWDDPAFEAKVRAAEIAGGAKEACDPQDDPTPEPEGD